jgi:predicted enzyme related to lactoylglutathione lyase
MVFGLPVFGSVPGWACQVVCVRSGHWSIWACATPAGRANVGPVELNPKGAIAYWHVDDVPAAYARLLSMGAQPHEAPRDYGEGFIGASVIDPFGNILGINYNPHYVEVLGSTRKA